MAEKSGESDAKKPKTEEDIGRNEFLAALNSEDEAVLVNGLRRFRYTVYKQSKSKANKAKIAKDDAAATATAATTKGLLEEYLLSSPQCYELLNLWKSHAPSDAVSQSVVEVLATILDRNVSPDTRTASAYVAKEVVRLRLKSLYQLMGEGSAPKTAAALRLLSSVVSLGAASARDVFAHVDFSLDCFSGATELRAKRERGKEVTEYEYSKDIRTIFMRMCLRFLTVGDSSLVQTVVLVPNLLGAFFTTIEKDPPGLIVEFLGCLVSRVLRNSDVARKPKAFLLNPVTLDAVAGLLASKSESVAAVAYEFLSLAVPILGASQSSRSRQLSELSRALPAKQRSLMALLRALKVLSPKCELHRRLAIDILRAAPDLVMPYLSAFRPPEPTLSLSWVEVSAFMIRAVSCAVVPGVSFECDPPSPQCIVDLVDLVVPFRSSFFSRCLGKSDVVVFRSLEILRACLVKVEALLGKLSGYPPNWGTAVATLRGSLKARLPSLQLVLGHRSRYTGNTAKDSLVLGNIFAVLCAYLRAFPELETEERFDLSKAIGTPSFLAPVPMYHMLELMKASPAMSSDGSDARIGYVCGLAVAGSARLIRREAARFLHCVLSRAGLFAPSLSGRLQLDCWLCNPTTAAAVKFLTTVIGAWLAGAKDFTDADNRTERMVESALTAHFAITSPTERSASGVYLRSVLFSLLPFAGTPPVGISRALENFSDAVEKDANLSAAYNHVRSVCGVSGAIAAAPAEEHASPAELLSRWVASGAPTDSGETLAAATSAVSESLIPVTVASAASCMQAVAESEDATAVVVRLLGALVSRSDATHGGDDCAMCEALFAFPGAVRCTANRGGSISEDFFSALNRISSSGCSRGMAGIRELAFSSSPGCVAALTKRERWCVKNKHLRRNYAGLVSVLCSELRKRELFVMPAPLVPFLVGAMARLSDERALLSALTKDTFEVVIQAAMDSGDEALDKIACGVVCTHESTGTVQKLSFDPLECANLDDFSKFAPDTAHHATMTKSLALLRGESVPCEEPAPSVPAAPLDAIRCMRSIAKTPSPDSFKALSAAVDELPASELRNLWPNGTDGKLVAAFAQACLATALPGPISALGSICRAVFKDCPVGDRSNGLGAVIGAVEAAVGNESLPWKEVSQLLSVVLGMSPDLVPRCGSVILPALAGAYRATTSLDDQAIFNVLRILDEGGAPLSIVGNAWGSFAVAFARTHSGSTTDAVLSKASGLIDPETVSATLSNYPVQRTLESLAAAAPYSGTTVYDPLFLLPLLVQVSASLPPETGCRSFIDVGALQIVLSSLASNDDALRGLSYRILSQFSDALVKERMRDKAQLQVLLKVLRNTVTRPNLKLPCLHATLLSHLVPVLMRADHCMYYQASQFLLSQPTLRLYAVPMIAKIIGSSHEDVVIPGRHWILEVLRDSITVKKEDMLWNTSQVIDRILTEFCDPATDKKTKELVFAVLLKMVDMWGWGGFDYQCPSLISWLCSTQVMPQHLEKVSAVLLRIAAQSESRLRHIGEELQWAAASLLQCSAVDAGLTVLLRVSKAVPKRSVPAKLYSLLSKVLAVSVARDDCASAKLALRAMVFTVPAAQQRPPGIDASLLPLARILDPEDRATFREWIAGKDAQVQPQQEQQQPEQEEERPEEAQRQDEEMGEEPIQLEDEKQ